MSYKFIPRGKIGISRDSELRTGLQTCSGIVMYAPGSIVGLAHVMAPKKYRDLYQKGMMLSNSDYNSEADVISPEEGAKKLLERLLQEGINKSKINAAIFGCQDSHEIGMLNGQESEGVLNELGIPITYNLTRKPYEIALMLNPERITFIIGNDPNKYYEGKKFFIPLKNSQS